MSLYTVHTHFSGSPCVVELTPGALEPGSNGAYIDVQRLGRFDRIEVVRAGRVIYRTHEFSEKAPERILSIMKEFVWEKCK